LFGVFTDDQPAAWLIHVVKQGGEPGDDRFLNGAGEVHGYRTVGSDAKVRGAGVGKDRGGIGDLHPHGEGQVMKR